MTSSDETLRRHFRVDRSTRDDRSCPRGEELWDAATGGARSEQLEAVLDHVAVCGACTEAWLLAKSLADETAPVSAATAPTQPAQPHTTGGRAGWAVLIAVAAAFVLMVAWPTEVRPPVEVESTQYRASSHAMLEPLLADGAVVDASKDLELRWQAVHQGPYDVRVMTEALEPVAQGSGLEEPSFVVQASILEPLRGTRLLWQVSLRQPDGSSLDSRTFTVVLR